MDEVWSIEIGVCGGDAIKNTGPKPAMWHYIVWAANESFVGRDIDYIIFKKVED
jgi:hypothetical protein